MKEALVIVVLIIIFLLGAISHEYDLARNFNETGDSKAWIYEIKR